MNLRSLFARGAKRRERGEQLTAELREEIRRSFDAASADDEHFPATIDPRIQHVKILLKFFGPLADKRVLDVGCGKGRFARVLKERHPGAEVWGLDISEEMLRFVPAGIHTRAGSMTELPFAASTFDCVYATESLEHAVEIGRAVAELCRVLKPGGKLVIIDKNAEHWGKLKTRHGSDGFSGMNWRNFWRGTVTRYGANISPIGKMLSPTASSLPGSR
jgi:malonyl-CoA O-methyltransferase